MTRPMNDHSRALVNKLWSYCNLLRDDGLSYGDYVEQLTYLLFLKMQNLLGHSKTKPALVHSQHKLSRFFRHPGVTTSSSTLEDSSLRLQPCLVSLKIDE